MKMCYWNKFHHIRTMTLLVVYPNRFLRAMSIDRDEWMDRVWANSPCTRKYHPNMLQQTYEVVLLSMPSENTLVNLSRGLNFFVEDNPLFAHAKTVCSAEFREIVQAENICDTMGNIWQTENIQQVSHLTIGMAMAYM